MTLRRRWLLCLRAALRAWQAEADRLDGVVARLPDGRRVRHATPEEMRAVAPLLLRERARTLPTVPAVAPAADAAVSALVKLGYQRATAREAVGKVPAGLPLADTVRAALQAAGRR